MRPAAIDKEVIIHAPAAHVWQFVGTAAGLRQWWKMDVTLEAKVGGRCVERGLFNGAPYQVEGIVTTYDPPRRLDLLLVGEQPGGELPTTMQITITLEEAAGVTTVRVVHQFATLVTAVTASAPPQYQPAAAFFGPRRPLPTILNQLPGQPLPGQVGERSAMSHPAAREAWVDTATFQVYTAWWAARLIDLLQLSRGEE